MTIEYRLEGLELIEWFDKLELGYGSHANSDDGMCVLEAIAWITGGEFNDHPDCVSPVIQAFSLAWNDSMDTTDRNRVLKPRMWGMVGTNTGNLDVEAELAWMATDWQVRVHTPAWLRLAGLDDQAATLEALPALNRNTAPPLLSVLDAVRADAVAAGGAAWVAARDAAWAALGAVRAAAWDAQAGQAAARAAALAAAQAAALAAARDAAGDALRPTVQTLQESAAALLKRMCDHAKQGQNRV